MIDAHTHVYCVIGNPVRHSRSPAMHNAAFRETGINGVYAAFQIDDPASAMAAVRALGIRGVSVTIPHKEGVIPCLDEVDEAARAIGAVNTVTNRDGRLIGTNTDSPGAKAAVREMIDPSGARAVVVGAGGSARAIVHGLKAAGATVTVANRSNARGEALAAEFGVSAIPLSEIGPAGCDLLVNTTPVGMAPDTDAMPVPESVLKPGMAVMDIVYNPMETKLLRAARAAGCSTLGGVEMLVRQGALQFEIWTGREAPVETMRDAVLVSLGLSGGRGRFETAP